MTASAGDILMRGGHPPAEHSAPQAARYGTVLLAGLPYSANLGDGAIADSLRHLLLADGTAGQVMCLDLSGRTAPAPQARDGRDAVVGLRRRPPLSHEMERLRRLAGWTGWRRRRLAEKWRPLVREADLVVVGGGQLLRDHGLNFPLALDLITDLAMRQGIPCVVHGVGVGARWSHIGGLLFRRALRRCRAVTVRDAVSADRLRQRAGAGTVQRLDQAADPALWAADAYGVAPAGDAGPVGVCLMVGALDGGRQIVGDAWPDLDSYLDVWETVVRRLLAAGHKVELFTNGAAEDEAAMHRLAARLDAAGQPLTVAVAPRPVSPAALARRIGGYRAVIAMRLHACILALSAGIPAFGIHADDKIAAFFGDLGAPDHARPILGTPADALAEAATAFAAAPRVPPRLEACRQAARASVAAL